jgi:HSP20 family protein
MLTTLPNRVSALLADPFHAAMRELNEDFHWSNGQSPIRKSVPLAIWEDEAAFYIEAEVPGVPLEDLDVSLEKGTLTIRGERKALAKSAKFDERLYGQFERTIALNEWVDPTNVDASLNNGVLQLKLAKRPESQPQKIKIADSRSTDSMLHSANE